MSPKSFHCIISGRFYSHVLWVSYELHYILYIFANKRKCCFRHFLLKNRIERERAVYNKNWDRWIFWHFSIVPFKAKRRRHRDSTGERKWKINLFCWNRIAKTQKEVIWLFNPRTNFDWLYFYSVNIHFK